MNNKDKLYDIVIWGATGYSGRPAAKYLNQFYASKGLIKMAIAGRNRDKLEKLHQELGNPDIGMMICPGADAQAANEVAKSTQVVCSAVGPAAKYSTEMVDACIANCTDYCDLSGELHWLRKMIDTRDAKAKAAGVLIVNACGMDSIPSEYGVSLLQNQALSQYGEYCKQVKGCFDKGKISVAAGSFESGKGVMVAMANDPDMEDIISNPYSLNPPGRMHGNPPCADLEDVVFDPDFDQYIMPFPVGQINARVVRRAHALQDFPYGKEFTYIECKLAGKGFINKTLAKLETWGVDLFVSANPNSTFGKLLMSLGPKDGSGPSDKTMEKNGPYSFVFFGRTPKGKTIKVSAFSPLDPHRGTAALLANSAYCVATERQHLLQEGGFWTPGTAIGDRLFAEMEKTGSLKFSAETSTEIASTSSQNPNAIPS